MSRNANIKLDEIKKLNHPILDLNDVFCVRGTKYDDIGPNHTKENKNNNKTTKNQHTLFLIFMDRTRNFFGPGFPQTKPQYFCTVCGNPGILVTFWTGQEFLRKPPHFQYI